MVAQLVISQFQPILSRARLRAGANTNKSKSSSRDADVFRLSEKAQGFFAAFSPDAALFHSAEGNAQIAKQPAVYPHSSGVNLFCDAVGATQVLRPDA